MVFNNKIDGKKMYSEFPETGFEEMGESAGNRQDIDNNLLQKPWAKKYAIGTTVVFALGVMGLNGMFTPENKYDRVNSDYDHPKTIQGAKVYDASNKFDEFPENIQKKLFGLESKFIDVVFNDIGNRTNLQSEEITSILNERDDVLSAYNKRKGKNVKSEWRPYISGDLPQIRFTYK